MASAHTCSQLNYQRTERWENCFLLIRNQLAWCSLRQEARPQSTIHPYYILQSNLHVRPPGKSETVLDQQVPGIYDLPTPRYPLFQRTSTRLVAFALERDKVYWSGDPQWYTRRVKEAIHIRLHPNNINRNNGIEILDAWKATIKKHNRRSEHLRIAKETISSRSSKDWNSPIAVNFRDVNTDA